MSITFSVDSVIQAILPIKEKPAEEVIRNLLHIHLETYQCQAKKLIPCKENAFLMTIDYAFNGHRPLIISPDHIWLLIAQGFGLHVRENAEALRHKFVAHEGKVELIAIHPGLKRGSKNPWEEIIPQLSQQIRSHIGAEIHDILTPKFSTTGAIETFAYEVTLMEAMNQYFSYRVTFCGIPKITLEGTIEDWETIQKYVQRFREYDLGWWVDALEPLLEEFVLASKGQARKKFWQSIYKLEGESGGPYVTGWIAKFFPYTENGDTIGKNRIFENPSGNLSIYEVPSGLSTVSIKCDDGLEEWDATIKAGFVGISQIKRTMALRPEIGWGVRDESQVETARKQQRLAQRALKKASESQFAEVSTKEYKTKFNKGVCQILRGSSSFGKFSPMKIQNNLADWVEVEYEDILYRYDAKTVPHDEAKKIMEAQDFRLRLIEDGLI